MYFRAVCEDRNGAESLVEVREDICDGIGIVDLDEIDVRVYAIIETVQVYEVNCSVFIILQLGYLESACVGENLPEVNSVF